MFDSVSDVDSAIHSKVRLRKPERKQIQMMVRCVDDLVKPTHQVRAVAAVVATLNLSGFCEPIKAREGHAGRDATDPQLLVSLWLYGCIRGIGSARELDRRCSIDDGSAPFQWLCGGVTVNHHLLSDFRVEHADALDELFTQVVVSLVDKDLVKVSRISQDGVRVRACAGAGSFRREQRLEQLLEEARAHVGDKLKVTRTFNHVLPLRPVPLSPFAILSGGRADEACAAGSGSPRSAWSSARSPAGGLEESPA